MSTLAFYPWMPGLVDIGLGAPVDPATGAAIMENVMPCPEGTRVRPGYVRNRSWESDSKRVAGLHWFISSGRNVGEFLACSVDVEEYDRRYQNHLIYAVDPVVNFDLDYGLNGVFGETPDYEVVNNELFIANPRSSVISWSKGGSPKIEPTIPNCYYLVWHKSRLLAGRLSDSQGSLMVSAPGNPRDFQTLGSTGRIDVTDRSDDILSGISPTFYGNVYTFTRRSFGVLQTAATIDQMSRQTISTSVGCSSNRSICQAGNDLLWVSEKGVHSLQTTQKYGDVESTFLSAPIQRMWNRISPDVLERSRAVYDSVHELYLIALEFGGASGTATASGDTSKILVLHVPSGRWAVWDLPATAMCMVRSFDIPGSNKVVIGRTVDGVAQAGYLTHDEHFDVTDADPRGLSALAFTRSPFRARVGTHWINCGMPSQRKNFRSVNVHFRSGAANRGKVWWQVGEQMATTTTTRLPNISEFYLNPGLTCPVMDIDDGPSQAGFFLGEVDAHPMQRQVSVRGSGAGAQMILEVDSGHPLDLHGIEVSFVAEGAVGFGELDEVEPVI